MRHLQPRPLEPTLNIEPLISLRAIQNSLCKTSQPNVHLQSSLHLEGKSVIKTYLITSHLLRNKVQRLNNSQSQLLPLLIRRHGNILNMPDQTQLVYKLALNNQRARAYDLVRCVRDA